VIQLIYKRSKYNLTKQHLPNNYSKQTLPKATVANKLKRKKTDQRIKTPIRKRKTSIGEFISDRRPNLQLSQRKDLRIIQNSSFKNNLIPMTPNLTNHRNPNILHP